MKKIKNKTNFTRVSNGTKVVITAGIGLVTYGIYRGINNYESTGGDDTYLDTPREVVRDVAENVVDTAF